MGKNTKRGDGMLKKIIPAVKGYIKPSIGASIMILIEGTLEILIPFMMTKLIAEGLNTETPNINAIIRIGGIMLIMAFAALAAGMACARFASIAGTGFACNLRNMLFKKIQGFSFANIDKFSTASLITRLTTDVSNMQMLFVLWIRMLVRNFVIMVAAFIFAAAINLQLSLVFAIAIPLLVFVMWIVVSNAYPLFEKMLNKLDLMNARVQENLISIRVVKAFVRGDYETVTFNESADALKRAQVRAEKIVAWMNPLTQLIFYAAMIAVCFFGGKLIVGGSMNVADLSGFLAYIGQILSSVMMLSAIFATFIMTRASQKRIVEVLDDRTDKDDSYITEDIHIIYGCV